MRFSALSSRMLGMMTRRHTWLLDCSVTSSTLLLVLVTPPRELQPVNLVVPGQHQRPDVLALRTDDSDLALGADLGVLVAGDEDEVVVVGDDGHGSQFPRKLEEDAEEEVAVFADVELEETVAEGLADVTGHPTARFRRDPGSARRGGPGSGGPAAAAACFRGRP